MIDVLAKVLPKIAIGIAQPVIAAVIKKETDKYVKNFTR